MPRSALATYDSLIPFADVTYVPWATLAADLRSEALTYSDSRSLRCLDLAEDCDMRAQRRASQIMQVRCREDMARAIAINLLAMGDLVAAPACVDTAAVS
jgi:hypothetical protein